MANALDALLIRAKDTPMTAEQKEAQRRSFAYGNSKIENELITRETIRQEAEKLAAEHGKTD